MAKKRIEIYIGNTSMRTCLGNKTETISSIHNGESGLKYNDFYQMYVGEASIKMIKGYTRFESILIEQIQNVLKESGLSLARRNVQLIISTTKGNIDLLANDTTNIDKRTFIYSSAKAIAKYFKAKNSPIVISNACISGVSAFIVGKHLLLNKKCKHVIIAGCDVLSEFITSGFASFKSISPKPCRPYDEERDGLTLAEAAGAIILTTKTKISEGPTARLVGGAITNDANHISGPSRTGDGLYYAMHNAMEEAELEPEHIGFINAHGTATRYNDEMESKAIAWAELNNKPLNSLKGHIGHILGASGVVETIICLEQLKQSYIFGTKGFVSSDTPHPLKVSADSQKFFNKSCIKTASGFGGCNAAIALDMEKRMFRTTDLIPKTARKTKVVAKYTLPQSDIDFPEFIRTEFKSFGESNMKFYKMCDMSKGLYVAVERLLEIESWGNIEPRRRAIILANRSASLNADIKHQEILNQKLPEGTSPAAFVYTLPNVAAGEMCIRHKIQGENTFFIEDKYSGFVETYAKRLIKNDEADAVICGWCEFLQGKWDIRLKLLKYK